jgi:hypothetical protein
VLKEIDVSLLDPRHTLCELNLRVTVQTVTDILKNEWFSKIKKSTHHRTIRVGLYWVIPVTV